MGRARDIANIINSGTFITPASASATYQQQIVSSSAVPTPSIGKLWTDTRNSSFPTLKYYNGSNWRPVVNYDANEVDIFNDGSGIALYRLDNNILDASGNYNGTTSTNVSFTTARKLGTHSGVFGGNATVAIPTIKNSYPFTVSAWATDNSSWDPSSGQREIMNLGIAGQRISLGIVDWDSDNTPDICLFYGGTNHWTSPIDFANRGSDQWHHIVWTINGSNDTNHKIYVDGVSKTMVNRGGGHGGNAGWRIGSNADSNSEFWNGNIDQLRFFNRVLTASEVQSLYTLENVGF
jgi:hypothetical protein